MFSAHFSSILLVLVSLSGKVEDGGIGICALELRLCKSVRINAIDRVGESAFVFDSSLVTMPYARAWS